MIKARRQQTARITPFFFNQARECTVPCFGVKCGAVTPEMAGVWLSVATAMCARQGAFFPGLFRFLFTDSLPDSWRA